MEQPIVGGRCEGCRSLAWLAGAHGDPFTQLGSHHRECALLVAIRGSLSCAQQGLTALLALEW